MFKKHVYVSPPALLMPRLLVLLCGQEEGSHNRSLGTATDVLQRSPRFAMSCMFLRQPLLPVPDVYPVLFFSRMSRRAGVGVEVGEAFPALSTPCLPNRPPIATNHTNDADPAGQRK